MKKFITMCLAVSMMISIFCPIVLAKSFSDISESHWAFKYVNELSDKGVINGYEDGTFKPEGNVTKAEFIKLLMCAESGDAFVPKESIVSYESGDEYESGDGFVLEEVVEYDYWYSPYFEYAAKNGFLTETVGEVYANDPITRKEMAFILGLVCVANKTVKVDIEYSEEELEEMSRKYFEDHDVPIGQTISFPIVRFGDTKELSDEEIGYIEAMADVGLITGYEDKTFRPDNNMTRAEVATIIHRFIEFKNKK